MLYVLHMIESQTLLICMKFFIIVTCVHNYNLNENYPNYAVVESSSTYVTVTSLCGSLARCLLVSLEYNIKLPDNYILNTMLF